MWNFAINLLGALPGDSLANDLANMTVQIAPFPIALAVIGGVMIAGGLYSAYKGMKQDIPTFAEQQPELFAQLQQESQGKFSGPFIADVAREQALQRTQAGAFGLAATGASAGVSPALALQQAQAEQGRTSADIAGQTAIARVQEVTQRTESARQLLFTAEGQERENALQKRELLFQLAGGSSKVAQLLRVQALVVVAVQLLHKLHSQVLPQLLPHNRPQLRLT